MDWVRSASGRAVKRGGLTAGAGHSGKDLAALQEIILSFVDL
jgi:hypothetical protein